MYKLTIFQKLQKSISENPLFFLIPFIFLVVYIRRRIKKTPVNKEQIANQLTGGNTKIQNIAREIAHHLGYAYPIWNYKRWTENDKEIYDLLKNLTPAEINQVANLYFNVYAKGRNLKSDLASVLDAKYYHLLTNL